MVYQVTRNRTGNKAAGTTGAAETNAVAAAMRTARNRRRRQKKKEKRQMMRQMHVVGSTRLVGSGINPRDKAFQYGVLPTGVNLGSTPNGKHAAIKALHPACELGAAQWPDRNTADTVAMENLDVVNIPPPPELKPPSSGEPAPAMVKWHLNIYLMPFPDNVALITRWWDGQEQPSVNDLNYNEVKITGQADMWSTQYTMIYSPPWDAQGNYPGDYFSSIRLTARSVTGELVAAGLYDQGTVYAGQAAIDIELQPLKTETTVQIALAMVEKIMNTMAEKGVSFAEARNTVSYAEELDVAGGSDAVDGVPPMLRANPSDDWIDQTNFYVVYQRMPDDYHELAQLDKKYYQCDAKEGVYLPLKHCATNDLELEPTAKQYHLCPKTPRVTAYRWGHHVMFGNAWQVGMTMWRNLLPAASVNCKFVSNVEASPLASGIMAKLAKPAPPLDQVALDQTQEVMCRLPSAFPAEANSLGTILDSIGKALAGSGIPLLSDVGKLTQTRAGKHVTGFLDTLL